MTADGFADAIAIAALLVSGGIGGASLTQSRKALHVALAQEARQAKDLALYLDESVAWSLAELDDRVLGFHLTVTNPSDRPNSIVRADLHVAYSLDATITVVQVPHTTGPAASNVLAGESAIDLPAQVAATGAVSGWFVFEVRLALTDGRPIDRYDVVIEDVHGIAVSRQVTIFREVPSAEAP